MGILGSAVIALLALFGTPLFTVILAAAMLGFYLSDIPLTVIPIEIYRLVDTPLLLALPLFTFAGYILAESRVSTRLVNCLLYTSPSPRDVEESRMPSSA